MASTQAQEVFEDLGGLGRPWLCEWRGLGGSASSTDSSGLWGAGGGAQWGLVVSALCFCPPPASNPHWAGALLLTWMWLKFQSPDLEALRDFRRSLGFTSHLKA